MSKKDYNILDRIDSVIFLLSSSNGAEIHMNKITKLLLAKEINKMNDAKPTWCGKINDLYIDPVHFAVYGDNYGGFEIVVDEELNDGVVMINKCYIL
jgi:hypothetical protein